MYNLTRQEILAAIENDDSELLLESGDHSKHGVDYLRANQKLTNAALLRLIKMLRAEDVLTTWQMSSVFEGIEEVPEPVEDDAFREMMRDA